MNTVAMDTISDCHCRLTQLLGASAKPLEVLRRTEEHRSYWRPERVKVILLAESHVYTTPEELMRTITLPTSATSGVRLVYCLGYGENRLLDRPIADPSNAGTPQFWKLFYSCVNPVVTHNEFAGIQGKVSLNERILNKIVILQRMRALGVWLVDTSAVDRHLLNFLALAGLLPCGYREAQTVINAAADILSIDRAYFDHSIWQFMSKRQAASNAACGDCRV